MARIIHIAGGIILVLAGIAMLALPGPGILTIAAGVLLLAKDVPAAERLVAWARPKVTRGEGTGEAAEESDPA